MEIIKIASSFHGVSMVKRTFGDDKWYKKSGKLEVKELKDYMPNECIQVWKINSSAIMTVVKAHRLQRFRKQKKQSEI